MTFPMRRDCRDWAIYIIHSFIHHSSSVYLSVCLSVYLSISSIHSSIIHLLSIYLCLSVCLSIYIPSIHLLSICLSVCLSIYPFIHSSFIHSFNNREKSKERNWRKTAKGTGKMLFDNMTNSTKELGESGQGGERVD